MHLNRFCRYLLVGLINNILTYSVTIGLLFLGSTIIYASSGGFIAGALMSYVLNSKFTFQTSQFSKIRLLFFLCLQFLIMILHSNLVLFFNSLNSPIFLSPILAIIVVIPVNYFAQKHLIFPA